jgi:hypothetical protein
MKTMRWLAKWPSKNSRCFSPHGAVYPGVGAHRRVGRAETARHLHAETADESPADVGVVELVRIERRAERALEALDRFVEPRVAEREHVVHQVLPDDAVRVREPVRVPLLRALQQ